MAAFHRFREEVPNRWALEFPEPSFDLASFDAFLDDFRALLLRDPPPEERIDLVVDLSNLGVPPGFDYVQRLVGFLVETDALRAERCGTTVIVAPSTALRTLVSTVCTIQPPCTPVEIVSERPRAEAPVVRQQSQR